MLHAFSDAECKQIDALIQLALDEDKITEDVTSKALFAEDDTTRMHIVAKQPLIFAGAQIVAILQKHLRDKLTLKIQVEDGASLTPGTHIAIIEGKTVALLGAERSILNLFQRISGVATLTHQFVEAVKHTQAKILDTRKTIPGWRALDKYAVRCGGGFNHRMNLADMIMIKDNHIAAAGSIERAIRKVKHLQEEGIPVVVECDNIGQVKVCLEYSVDRILLDNMPLDTLRQAVELVAGKIPLEASGGINLQTIRGIAETGVDYISVGYITHSAIAVDIGLEALAK